MEEKIYMKEKKKMPQTVVVLIVAIIGAIIGSLFTYALIKDKVNGSDIASSSSNTDGSKVITIEGSTDSPVVAMAQKASPSVVVINVTYTTQTYNFFNMFGNNGNNLSQESSEEGSGIIYSQDGYIITNYHVIQSAVENDTAKITVTLPNDETEYEAKIIGGDETTDLAVIKIDKTGLTAAEFGESSNLNVGELVAVIGNPYGKEFANSVTVGYISALNRKLTISGRTYNLIQTDAAINAGNSGGALVNNKGQVIGISSAKISSTDVEGMCFAIPIDEALPIIKELISDGKITRPYIGIVGMNVTETMAKMYNLQEGVYVYSIDENSPASKVNLKKGDVVTAIDSTEITTMEELNEIKNKKKIGDKVTLTVDRAGEKINVEVVLEANTNSNKNTTN